MLKFIVFAALGLGFVPSAMAAPAIIDCSGNWDATVQSLTPEPQGPLTLSSLRCLPISQSGYPVSLSPDGKSAFSFHQMEGLWVGGVGHSGPSRTFPGRVSAISNNRDAPFGWRADSSAVMGVAQETDSRGFALGALQPYLFTTNGEKTPLPPISHPNGPLDEIFWLDGSDLALVMLGTRGQYYRPERTGNLPTMALVNVATGKIRQSIELENIPGLSEYRHQWTADTAVNTNGTRRILIAWGPNLWTIWEKDEIPKIVPIKVEAQRPTFRLSADGTKVLILGNLSATGWICELGRKCPAPTPKSGMIAELREVTSGEVVWSIKGTAQGFSSARKPAISPDGRYALISMPDEKQYVALVSMSDGACRFR